MTKTSDFMDKLADLIQEADLRPDEVHFILSLFAFKYLRVMDETLMGEEKS